MTAEFEGEVSQPPDIQKFWPFFVAAATTVVVTSVGQVTGHYHGFYAQTDIALNLQIVMIVALAFSMFLSAWRADYAE